MALPHAQGRFSTKRSTASLGGIRDLFSGSRFEWAVLAAVSVATFFLLVSGGRFPTVDLPQHALLLRRLVEGTTEFHQLCWSSPYLLFYLLAALLTPFADPMTAVLIATSLILASFPLVSGFLAHALGRNPIVGVFALLGAFTTVTGWGFGPLLMGASVAGLAFAFSVLYAATPSTSRGTILGALLAASYSTHIMAAVVAFPLTLACVATRLSVFRLVTFWPFLLSGAWVFGLARIWRSGGGEGITTGGTETFAAGPAVQDRLRDIVTTATQFGKQEALALPWTSLAVLGILAAVISWGWIVRSLRSGEGRDNEFSRKRSIWGLLSSLTPPLGPIVSLGCFLWAPLTLASTFLVYPRFLVFLFLFWPALMAPLPRRAARWLGGVSVFPALALVFTARNEIVRFQDETECLGPLAAKLRPNESLKPVRLAGQPYGYSQPLFAHLAAELTAQKGGHQDVEFADYGFAPVQLQPGVQRVRLTWGRDPGEQAEYTAWLVIHPRVADVRGTYLFGRDLRLDRCGDFILATDEKVPAGSRPHIRFLPHRSP